MTPSPVARPCPCGTPSYDACCGRLHRGEVQAAAPEELMRSRFSAYAVGDTDYVWRTWHPRTRPATVSADQSTRWTALEVVEASEQVVQFRAHYDSPQGPGVLHERSSFEQRAGRWFYLEAL